MSYVDLAVAIVNQAKLDYIRSVKWLKNHPHARTRKEVARRAECYRLINDCERFFLSQWFYELTGCDGKPMLKMLKKM